MQNIINISITEKLLVNRLQEIHNILIYQKILDNKCTKTIKLSL